jgi:hypothetical protein
MAYATVAEFTAATGQPEPGDEQATQALQRRLWQASNRLDELTVTAVYPVDGEGMPRSAAVASAFRDACVEQAKWMEDAERRHATGHAEPAGDDRHGGAVRAGGGGAARA